MDKLINFSMIIYYIVMSKNAGLDKLCKELAILPDILDDSLLEDSQSVIIARVLPGVSSEKLRKACIENNIGDWHAIPARSEDAVWEGPLQLTDNTFVPVTPFREISGVITRGMFAHVLSRELARLKRNAGCLSILSASVLNGESIVDNLGGEVLARLEALLASILLEHLETCDSVGILRKGQFLCCLPGLGQLAARNIAEKCKHEFSARSFSFFSQKNNQQMPEVECAIGIVNLLNGECSTVKNLINRSSAALEMAQTRNGNHIYQESSVTPLENTTLVQSSEKQFLFFGSTTP